MFTKLINYITQFKRTSTKNNQPSQLVIFDGDQCNTITFDRLFSTTNLDSTKYIWVSAGSVQKSATRSASTPNQLEIVKVKASGKEASDTQIALCIVDALARNPALKTVFIVSNDGDFCDTATMIGNYFPNAKFVLVRDQLQPTSKKAKSNRNCSIVLLKKIPSKKSKK